MGKLIIDGKVIDHDLTEAEFEELWKKTKEADNRRADAYDALPDAKKAEIEERLNTPFSQRMRCALTNNDLDMEY